MQTALPTFQSLLYVLMNGVHLIQKGKPGSTNPLHKLHAGVCQEGYSIL